ncbi:hypothetical protein KM043_018061 [Ampulex compressa]|nr:hypothetical protein KM043_018061 [Ampulex compressa]
MIGPLIVALALWYSNAEAGASTSYPWHYKCVGGLCKKELITNATKSPRPLEICQLFCGESGALWPKPTGHYSLTEATVHVDPENVVLAGVDTQSQLGSLLQGSVAVFKNNVRQLGGKALESGGAKLSIRFEIEEQAEAVTFSLDSAESYVLQIAHNADTVNTTISAKTFFGVRHGLETLSQLIVFNDFDNQIQIVSNAYISDGPVYPYRGILLDTSRNYVEKAGILRTIDGMAASKMNVFHWHITDSQSFPYVSKTYPQFSEYGAYAKKKVYTADDIKEIVQYGLVRGVRVLPEFDAPAHVGEGWQWVGDNATVCFKAEPWRSYCVEPPCGQLNPTSEKVYEILEGIYGDMLRDFYVSDVFHMGGDEVNLNCWRSSDTIKNWMTKEKNWDHSDSSFYLLWDYFQDRAYEKLTRANGGKEVTAVLWTSGLTSQENLKYLDPTKYIIQIWTTGADETIGRLLRSNFRVIFSNYDALYFDCGFGAWVGEGNNWCSPYKGWQVVYENSPLRIAKGQGLGNKKHLIQGGEATLWTEQADGSSVDNRLWPRAAALAERLWAEPTSSWTAAEQRMLRHRERLVARGIPADTLEPMWCLQNQGHCYG